MNLTNFEFKGRPVRIVTKDSQPWFVAHDVCMVLGISKHRDAVSRLEDDERGSVTLDTLGGAQSVAAISESGLYALIFKSQKPQAKAFRKWVTGEVLPQIRQTGQFSGRLPSRAELARMVIEQDEKLGIAGEIFDRVYPTTRYGEIGRNGLPKTGIRRAAFVAAHNRMTDAGRCYELAAQIELNLALQP